MKRLLLTTTIIIVSIVGMAQVKPGTMVSKQKFSTVAAAMRSAEKYAKILLTPRILSPVKGTAINVAQSVVAEGTGKPGCRIIFQALWIWAIPGGGGRSESNDYWTAVTVDSKGHWETSPFLINFPEPNESESVYFWFYQIDPKSMQQSNAQSIKYSVMRKSPYDKIPGEIKTGPVKVHPKDKHSLNPQPIPPKTPIKN